MSGTIFSEDELAADAVTATDDAPAIDTPPADRARDEQGRFAPHADPAADAKDGEPQHDRTVPHGALHQEREKHRATRGELEAARAQLAQFQQLRERVAQSRQQPREPLPVTDDPAAETQYLRQRLDEIGGAVQGMQQHQQLGAIEANETQTLGAVLTQSEHEFRASKPDYDEAIGHVIQARSRELSLYGLNPMQIQETLRAEVLDITRAAIQQGRSPAEVGYELAQLRGYRPAADQSVDQQPSPAQRQVAAVGQARSQSRSLSQAAGSGTLKDLNAQSVANMSQDEFEALYSTPEGRKLIDAL